MQALKNIFDPAVACTRTQDGEQEPKMADKNYVHDVTEKEREGKKNQGFHILGPGSRNFFNSVQTNENIMKI